MLDDLDETIRQLLIKEIPLKNGEVDIKFDQPKREWSARLTKPTLNLFLYDVRENAALRHHQWETTSNGRAGQVGKKRTPFRLDCYYMLTAWASEPDDEHRLLTRAMLALFRHPVLLAEQLVGDLQKQAFDLQARLAVHDKLTNPAEIWGSLDNEIRPSVPYIITLSLDPWAEVSGPIVRTFTVRTGQTDSLPYEQKLREDGIASELVVIAGTVHDSQGLPQSNVDVAIKGTGYATRTNTVGQFRLGSLLPGSYTLMAWGSQGKPVEKKIEIPATNGDYNIEL